MRKTLAALCRRLFIFSMLLALTVATSWRAYAHEQPTTLILLDVAPSAVTMTLHLPLDDLELAFGHDVTRDPVVTLERWRLPLRDYLVSHIRVTSEAGRLWTVDVEEMGVEAAGQTESGPFQEVTVQLVLTPPEGASTRMFTLHYDVIMHQVVSHKAIVSVQSDWETGTTAEHGAEIGIIMVDTGTSQISPLEIDLGRGSWWQGFGAMIGLGMQHIKEGTDHLLFLLVLLLPAMLTVQADRWRGFGGARYGVRRLVTIVTAFTVGHSVTLLLGAWGLVRLPHQPVEVVIAVSILISAVHAVRPLFAGKEAYVAAGFGLVHGLGFSSALRDLNLGAGPMALSILGFNLGVELMQVFVIAVTMPWLVVLSLTPIYSWVRIAGASLAAVASLGWIASRVSGEPNVVDSSVLHLTPYAPFGIFLLALVAIPAYAYWCRDARTRRQTMGDTT